MVRRRRILQAIAATGTISLAGCAGDDSGENGNSAENGDNENGASENGDTENGDDGMEGNESDGMDGNESDETDGEDETANGQAEGEPEGSVDNAISAFEVISFEHRIEPPTGEDFPVLKVVVELENTGDQDSGISGYNTPVTLVFEDGSEMTTSYSQSPENDEENLGLDAGERKTFVINARPNDLSNPYDPSSIVEYILTINCEGSLNDGAYCE